MSSIQLPGLNTGIDTKAMIDQLIMANSRRLNVYEQRREQADAKRTSYNDLKIKLQDFESAIEKLSDQSKLKSFMVTSSNEDALTASASSNAFEGTASIEIGRLATSDKYIHSGFEYMSSYVGEGKFIFSYDHEETVIQTTEETTLEDLVGLINNDPDNPGVTASVIKYNDQWHMVLSGADSGSDYAININTSTTQKITADDEFTFSTNEATLQTKLTGLDQFSGNLGTTDTITIKDGPGGTALGSFTVTNNTTMEVLINEINKAFDGTATAKLVNGKIQLVDDVSGTSTTDIELEFTADPAGSAALTLPTFTVATAGGLYSTEIVSSLDPSVPDNYTHVQQASDSQIKVDGYPPGVDQWITNSGNTIDDVISGVTLNLHNATAGDTVELSLTRNTETLKSDIDEMVGAYNTLMTYIKTETDYNKQTGKAGKLIGDYMTRSVKNVLRQPLTLSADGFVDEYDTFKYASQIGLSIQSDGMLEFDKTKFDEAIVENYDDVLSLFGAKNTGSTNNASLKFYGSTDDTTAGNYEVQVTVSGGVITAAQIRQLGESTWRDATWSDGGIVTGNLEWDEETGQPLYPEYGLQFSVDLTQGGTVSGMVRVKQGFAREIDNILEDFLDSSDGRIKLSQDSMNRKIENLDKMIEREQLRLDRERERLTARFAHMEKYLTMIQQQFSGIV